MVIVKAAGMTGTTLILKTGRNSLPIGLSPPSGDWGNISFYVAGPLELTGGNEQTLVLAREGSQPTTTSVNIYGLRLSPAK
jgi:hypothetical protein